MTRTEQEALEKLLRSYREQRDLINDLAKVVESQVLDLASVLGLKPVIMSRAKTLESLAGKFQRKIDRGVPLARAGSLGEYIDLCGVRAILHTRGEVSRLSAEVHNRFLVDPEHSVDKISDMDISEFGYSSRHLIFSLKETRGAQGWTPEQEVSALAIKIELQIRTFTEHSWAEVSHDMDYKSDFAAPKSWKRELARISANLEACDQGYEAIYQEHRLIESSYHKLITPEEVKSQIEMLETLLAIDATDVRVIHRLIRLYLAWDQPEKYHDRLLAIIETHCGLLETYPPLLRDAGFGLTKIAKGRKQIEEGREMLKKAINMRPNDLDAICSLAGSLRKEGNALLENQQFDEGRKLKDEAHRLYSDAYFMDPGFSYALGNYLIGELEKKGDLDPVLYARAAILEASRRCQRQIEIGINLPWALYDLAQFQFFTQQSTQGFLEPEKGKHLDTYLRGILISSSSWMPGTAWNSLNLLAQVENLSMDGLDCVLRLLNLGKRVRELGPTPAPPPSRESGRHLIVAGGCGNLDPDHKEGLADLRKILETFRGTIFSGGTDSGVAGMVGTIQAGDTSGKIRSVGYLPRKKSGDRDSRYTSIVMTEGDDFSELEALCYWKDLLDKKVHPSRVLLVGFGGGRISAFEYRLALTLGAHVAIVQGSGGSADQILSDPDWQPILQSATWKTAGVLTAVRLKGSTLGKLLAD